ncbi:hypothetical protein ACS0TY_019398 [Phlomoides rotata]
MRHEQRRHRGSFNRETNHENGSFFTDSQSRADKVDNWASNKSFVPSELWRYERGRALCWNQIRRRNTSDPTIVFNRSNDGQHLIRRWATPDPSAVNTKSDGMHHQSQILHQLQLRILLTLLPCQAKTPANLTTDQSALLSLKAILTSDPYQIVCTRNGTNSSDVCSWIGVTCRGLRYRRVTTLNISNIGLPGTIPPQLGNLSSLVSLNHTYNSFSREIPEKLGRLHNL